MATGQTILNLMEVLHPELQLQAGESNVTKGLVALNAAQDYMESVFALQPDLLGDGKGTVSTIANTETTTFPSGLLRLDGVQLIDSTTLLPVFTLKDLRQTGAHAGLSRFPLYITLSSTTTACPDAYWTDGSYFYWSPMPDAAYTMRYYGFTSKSDITASGTFGYKDICMLPLANFAVKLIRTGLDDDVSQYDHLAKEIFTPVAQALSNFQRTSAPGYQYRDIHNT